ncbi:MAG: molybdenum cofactor guanylyltransferase [Planctomycetota bacterium]|jgi:molybdopterin-guanine dinucleotide biosynthesis protein A|nr:molybdenum cofactor guanylyltransferase [Planctomycetota bacterium]
MCSIMDGGTNRIEGLCAAILCGGRSARMGRDKASVPFLGEPMLARLARRLSDIAPELVIAAGRKERSLPPLPAHAHIVHDERDYEGPLAGCTRLASAIAPQTRHVLLCACDLPLIDAHTIRALHAEVGDATAIVPVVAGRAQTLCSLWRREALEHFDRLWRCGKRKMAAVLDLPGLRLLDDDALAAIDVDPTFLVGCNDPVALARAEARASQDQP